MQIFKIMQGPFFILKINIIYKKSKHFVTIHKVITFGNYKVNKMFAQTYN